MKEQQQHSSGSSDCNPERYIDNKIESSPAPGTSTEGAHGLSKTMEFQCAGGRRQHMAEHCCALFRMKVGVDQGVRGYMLKLETPTKPPMVAECPFRTWQHARRSRVTSLIGDEPFTQVGWL